MLNRNYLRYFIIVILQFLITTTNVAAKVTVIESLDIPDNIAFFDENDNKKFLDQFENKTVLLVFWATWCSSCTKEMPDLDILQKDFRKLPFEVVAVSQDFQGVKIVQDYFKAQEIRHLKIYHDYKNELFKAFSVAGIPTSFLINSEGKMVATFTGNINWNDNEIRSIILSHIDGNPPEPKNSYKSNSLNQAVKPIPANTGELPTPSTSTNDNEEQPSNNKALKGDKNGPNN